MSIIQGTAKGGGSTGEFYDYPIEQSLRFDGSSYLSKSSLGSGSTFTLSLWVKLSSLDENKYVMSWNKGSGLYTGLAFASPTANSSNSPNSLYFYNQPALTYTTQAYRDLSGYYHIVWSSNTGSSTLYVNSNSVLSSVTTPALNSTIYLGKYAAATTLNFNGYMANIQFIDGQALTPTSFAETKNGVWIPKNPSGLTYGTNGFRLSFERGIETLGGVANQIRDESSNSNHWTKN